jgi:hypothetical protein
MCCIGGGGGGGGCCDISEKERFLTVGSIGTFEGDIGLLRSGLSLMGEAIPP